MWSCEVSGDGGIWWNEQTPVFGANDELGGEASIRLVSDGGEKDKKEEKSIAHYVY